MAEGFTLPEVLISTALFILLVGGIVFANLFGLSMFSIMATKLNATAAARKTIGKMTDEIRTCKTTWIGSITNGDFVALLDGETQEGSGLLIYPTTNTADFIIYFVNPSDKTFRRTTSVREPATILADTITNTMVFRAQDFFGTVLTNHQDNHVIHMNLEFYQPQRHVRVADYYKLETSVTRRVLE